ncbi:hypothetical protein [Bradyrhizobium sp. LMG 9283]|uniref:hypothetical protein n=1 Tax=Bradyrhizobium sp. LMG 9283 TaxID=592064 RepID=UPI00388D2CB3
MAAYIARLLQDVLHCRCAITPARTVQVPERIVFLAIQRASFAIVARRIARAHNSDQFARPLSLAAPSTLGAQLQLSRAKLSGAFAGQLNAVAVIAAR